MAPTSARNTKNVRKSKRNAGTTEMPAPIVSTNKPAPQLKAPQRAAVDAIFQNDASVRQAITET